MDIYHAMSYIIWGTLCGSTILTVFAVVRKSINLTVIAALPLLLVYGFLGYFFGINGILVSGLLGLLLTGLQLALIIGFAFKFSKMGMVLLLIAAIVIWVNLLAYVYNPFGWK